MNETPKELDAAVKKIFGHKPPKDSGKQLSEAAKSDGSGEPDCKSKQGDIGRFLGGMVNKTLTMLGVLSVALLFMD